MQLNKKYDINSALTNHEHFQFAKFTETFQFRLLNKVSSVVLKTSNP